MTEKAGCADGEPLLAGMITDPVAAMIAAFVTLAAIRRRRNTGRGLCVEVPLRDVAAQLSARPVIEASATGRQRSRTENRSPHVAPQGMYRCADDALITVSVTSDRQWSSLAALPGLTAWADDERLTTLAGQSPAPRRTRQHPRRVLRHRALAQGRHGSAPEYPPPWCGSGPTSSTTPNSSTLEGCSPHHMRSSAP
ncbi:CoA transferase [Streptomyces thinghirensis]|uniref:CoA transferase n=1 Tax=Streptomyces thinghirensis TaxID=551547 RepID=UPI003CD07171